MEKQSKGSRGLEAYCKGGQGPPQAVAPSKKKKRRSKSVLVNLRVDFKSTGKVIFTKVLKYEVLTYRSLISYTVNMPPLLLVLCPGVPFTKSYI